MSKTIGVFDSGVGGLTVLRALQTRMPGHDYIYLCLLYTSPSPRDPE